MVETPTEMGKSWGERRKGLWSWVMRGKGLRLPVCETNRSF